MLVPLNSYFYVKPIVLYKVRERIQIEVLNEIGTLRRILHIKPDDFSTFGC